MNEVLRKMAKIFWEHTKMPLIKPLFLRVANSNLLHDSYWQQFLPETRDPEPETLFGFGYAGLG